MAQSSGKIRTEAEGRELWLPYAMNFLRQAKIEDIITCDEDANGNLIVIERKLIATVSRSDAADVAQKRPSSSQPDQGVRIR